MGTARQFELRATEPPPRTAPTNVDAKKTRVLTAGVGTDGPRAARGHRKRKSAALAAKFRRNAVRGPIWAHHRGTAHEPDDSGAVEERRRVRWRSSQLPLRSGGGRLRHSPRCQRSASQIHASGDDELDSARTFRQRWTACSRTWRTPLLVAKQRAAASSYVPRRSWSATRQPGDETPPEIGSKLRASAREMAIDAAGIPASAAVRQRSHRARVSAWGCGHAQHSLAVTTVESAWSPEGAPSSADVGACCS